MSTIAEHTLSIMDISGHAELHWDVNDSESVEDAEEMFDDLIDKGYQAFETSYVAGNPGKGRKLTSFDPTLQEIIMIPPVAGG